MFHNAKGLFCNQENGKAWPKNEFWMQFWVWPAFLGLTFKFELSLVVQMYAPFSQVQCSCAEESSLLIYGQTSWKSNAANRATFTVDARNHLRRESSRSVSFICAVTHPAVMTRLIISCRASSLETVCICYKKKKKKNTAKELGNWGVKNVQKQANTSFSFSLSRSLSCHIECEKIFQNCQPKKRDHSKVRDPSTGTETAWFESARLESGVCAQHRQGDYDYLHAV